MNPGKPPGPLNRSVICGSCCVRFDLAVERDPVTRIDARCGPVRRPDRRRPRRCRRACPPDRSAYSTCCLRPGPRLLDRSSTRRLAVGALVGVGGADAAGDVAAVVDVLGERLQRPRAAGLVLLAVAVRVVHEHERHRRPASSRSGRPRGPVPTTVNGILSPQSKKSPSSGVVICDRRRGVADRDRRRLGVGLAAGVGDRQLGRVDAVGGVDVRRVRDRSSRPCRRRRSPTRSVIESPGSGSREPSLEKWTVSGAMAVRRRRVQRRPAARACP